MDTTKAHVSNAICIRVNGLLDTHTYPEPDKTVDELWFDARVHGQYGSLMDSMRYGEEIAVDLRNIDDSIDSFQFSIPSRPNARQVDVPGWFVRTSLGKGTAINYWDTQRKLIHRNAKAADEIRRRLVELEKARKARVVERRYSK